MMREKPFKRLLLRPMKIKNDSFPSRIRASTIASFWWCGYKSYLCAMKGVTIPEKEWMTLGTSLHDKLFETLGKRFPWEDLFIEKIDEQRKNELGFVREFHWEGEDTDVYVDITGHPDDFQVAPCGLVTLIEYKTTRMPVFLAKKFLVPVAKFQARLYPWVLAPTVAKLENEIRKRYAMARWNSVMVYSSQTMERLHYTTVSSHPDSVENSILGILRLFREPEKIVPCVPWKCRYCSDVFHAICPYYKERKEQGLLEPKKRRKRK